MNAHAGARSIAAGTLLGVCLTWVFAAWSAQPVKPDAAFVEWAKTSAVPLSTVKPVLPWDDLESLGRMIDDAPIVAVTEGTHGAAEPLEFRNRLLQYLVQKKGFTAIAIESGLVEGRVVHDYVRTGAGDLSKVLFEGLSWTFDQLPQNETLIRWIRQYNAHARHARKVNFYGFDVSGSPGGSNANRNEDTALRTVLQYLTRVDREAAAAFHARLDPLLENVRYDLTRPDGPNYSHFSSSERDALTAGIADLIALLERKEAKYGAAGGADEYEWAYRAVIGARQVDEWLREIPPRSQPPHLKALLQSASSDVRDRAQADNIDWIVNHEGAYGKVLIFAHVGHLAAAPLVVKWFPAGDAEGEKGAEAVTIERVVAGTYLRRRHGKQLVIIGNLIGGGKAGCANYGETLQQAPGQSSTGLAGAVGERRYLLDLRSAPAPVAAWLNQPHSLGIQWAQYANYERTTELPLGKAFDILFYADTVTPACRIE